MDPVDAGIFEAWLASTDDGALAVDAEGRVVLHNPAASRVTGLPPAAALTVTGRKSSDSTAPSPLCCGRPPQPAR